MAESTLFQALDNGLTRGSIRLLFANRDRIKRFLLCILIATPIPLVFWMLIAFAPEFTQKLGLSQPLSSGQAVIFGYIGLASGDLCACLLSQLIKSRRKTLLLFLASNSILCLYFLAVPHGDHPGFFKLLYMMLGFTAGYWAMMVLIAAESFGTNLRATVATSVPNLARATAIPIGMALSVLKEDFGLLHAAMMISIFVYVVGLAAAFAIKETYGVNLDYIEPSDA